MRPAEPHTQKKKLLQLIDQTSRAYRTSVWQFRNAPDSIKVDVKVVMQHLKDASDELERLRDRAMALWEKPHKAAPPPKIDQKKIDALSDLMPGIEHGDAARVIAMLGEILGQHVTQNK